jgi:hypothetical protein
MRKVLFIISPFTEDELHNAIDTAINIMKSLGVYNYKIDLRKSGPDVKLSDKIIEKFNVVNDDYEVLIKKYDDIYMLESDREFTLTGDVNSVLFQHASNLIKKFNIITVKGKTTEVSSLEDIIIDDFIGDSFIVGKTRKEIHKFINIYLDNLNIMADTPEYAKEVSDVKRGLNILYNRLEGLKEEDNG